MIKIDTPYKRAVHMIIHSVINRDPKYWLDNTYVRWGKIEKDLWALKHLAQQPIEGDALITSDGICTGCGKWAKDCICGELDKGNKL